jgi:CRISPR-associated endonuclease Csn1
MKKILGLDLGSSSVGWAFVQENEENTTILGAGVRIVSLTSDETNDFQKGKAISINKDRTLRRGARRGLQRFKQRREAILRKFKSIEFISKDFKYAEEGSFSTHQSYANRAKAATEKISQEQFVQVLLMLNKKRGYKSSRKAQEAINDGQEMGVELDGMEIAQKLYHQNITPAQYALPIVLEGGDVPEFYASDLTNELKRIVHFQLSVNSKLPQDLLECVLNKSRNATYYYFDKISGIQIAENKGTRDEIKKQKFTWRTSALTEKVDASVLAYILGDLNDQISKASGYLGKISDNSKELTINNLTVGQHQYKSLTENPHTSQRNWVFKRSDYLNEFERIWETQNKFYPELTEELKIEIRDITIFYQRKLKSQKHLISFCEFEAKHRVAPKSSPVFQLFRMHQNINNIEIKSDLPIVIDEEVRNAILEILTYNGTLKDKDFLIGLGINHKEYKINFEKINGDLTRTNILKILIQAWEKRGNSTKDLEYPLKKSDALKVLDGLGLPSNLLDLDIELGGNDFDKQPYYQLWHVLYSLDDDAKVVSALTKNFGFTGELAKAMLSVKLEANYGSLSAKAMRKIIPHLSDGLIYSEACAIPYKTHSKLSLSNEQNDARQLKEKLDLIKKNSIRNPVVEKVLNQTINVVNAIIASEKYGKPDEIRIELARELRASNEEREMMTKSLSENTKLNEEVRNILQKDFNLARVTRNDIIRYKLWQETSGISIYTGKPIPASDLFSGKYDVDHIIPQSRLFDDSFSNKVLCERELNNEKDNQTAYSFLKQKFSNTDFEQFVLRVKELSKLKKIKHTKGEKLLLTNENIPDDFIQRQLNETQYISKKAKEILHDICRNIYTTTGSITDKLREDWGLVEIMKELNFSKYQIAGLTYEEQGKNGERLLKIKDWSKRNDHRHHALDAITIALTKPAYIQYLNNLNANNKGIIQNSLQNKYIERIDGKWRFKSPIINIRGEVKSLLESILISHKAKNKVVTKNINKIKTKSGIKLQSTLTPRGPLHKETIYGEQMVYETSLVSVGVNLTEEAIFSVANKKEREALLSRLHAFENDPKKAFTGKNSPAKNPILYDLSKNKEIGNKVKVVSLTPTYTVKKLVGPDLDEKKIQKIVDIGVQRKLMERLAAFGGDPKKAFINLDENPIYLDKQKKITIKSVKLSGITTATAIHTKNSNPINSLPKDWVSLSNNHHVAIFEDENGNYQDELVSFFTAVTRATAIPSMPIIQREHPNGWKFLFTMKANELFVFPSDEFNPSEVDFTNPKNYQLISRHLYRVQKLSLRYYVFRHHLETNVEETKELFGLTWKRITNNSNLKGAFKVRLNHLGEIVKIGE